jgi:NAD(P)H dehydrogenase (quinone)
MKISIILAHPNKDSLNHAIARTAAERLESNGHTVSLHDLHAEKFDPLLPAEEFAKDAVLPESIRRQCTEIQQADGVIVVHPNWWGQPPAILKGWIDRVIRAGVCYDFVVGDSGEGVPKGLMRAKAAIVFNTSNTPDERERELFGDPLETIWRTCVFGLCGVGNFYRRTFSIVITSTESERKQWLEEVGVTVDRFFPKP